MLHILNLWEKKVNKKHPLRTQADDELHLLKSQQKNTSDQLMINSYYPKKKFHIKPLRSS